MGLYCAVGSLDTDISLEQASDLLAESLEKLGSRNRVLAVPPDITRLHSQAGALTCAAHRHFGDRLKAVLPAIGTHTAMTPEQMNHMFPGVPHELFRVHNWRTDIETLGEIPSEFIREQSEGKLSFAWPAQVNRLISQGDFDLILSIGQVVPHEVIGMANYNKNILVGTGGRHGINLSH
jgi:nickel-dependent lactate racemase